MLATAAVSVTSKIRCVGSIRWLVQATVDRVEQQCWSPSDLPEMLTSSWSSGCCSSSSIAWLTTHWSIRPIEPKRSAM